MTIAAVIVLILRLIVPLTIFRWRISGAIASMVLDGVDVILVELIAGLTGEVGGFGDYYQHFDKWTDFYYLSIEAYVSLSWQNRLCRNTSIALYIFRVVGFAAFEITGGQYRKLIFFFPNLFENFFLYVIIADRVKPNWVPRTKRALALVLFILYVPKFGQEYLLHFPEAQPWEWTKTNILGID